MLQSTSAASLRGGAEGPRPAAAPGRRHVNPPPRRRLYVSYNSDNTGRVCPAGVCVQVSLQIHTQVVKSKRSCVVKGESEPSFSHRTTFKLRSQHLDEACLRVELLQPSALHAGATLISLDFL